MSAYDGLKQLPPLKQTINKRKKLVGSNLIKNKADPNDNYMVNLGSIASLNNEGNGGVNNHAVSVGKTSNFAN